MCYWLGVIVFGSKWGIVGLNLCVSYWSESFVLYHGHATIIWSFPSKWPSKRDMCCELVWVWSIVAIEGYWQPIRALQDALKYENGKDLCGSSIIVEWARGTPRPPQRRVGVILKSFSLPICRSVGWREWCTHTAGTERNRWFDSIQGGGGGGRGYGGGGDARGGRNDDYRRRRSPPRRWKPFLHWIVFSTLRVATVMYRTLFVHPRVQSTKLLPERLDICVFTEMIFES